MADKPKKRNKLWAIYEISLIAIFIPLMFYGFHYFITRVIDTPVSFSLLLLIPTFLLLAPTVIFAYIKTYRVYYTDNIPDKNTSLSPRTSPGKLFIRFIILNSLFMFSYVLSFLYLVFRNNLTIGLIFGLITVIIYIFILPVLKETANNIKIP